MRSAMGPLSWDFYGGDGRVYWRHRKWLELSLRRGLALQLMQFDEDDCYTLNLHLVWPGIYIKLPFCKVRRRIPIDEMLLSWGGSLFGREVHFSWGDAGRIVHLPWSYDWARTSYLMKDQTWLHDLPARRGCDRYKSYVELRDKVDAGQWSQDLDYRYTLKSGEVQERTATITVREYESRQRWLRWSPWFAHVNKCIDVKFDGEVGERTGSWKGGTIGCGYDMLHGETPTDCLRRMERERKFR